MPAIRKLSGSKDRLHLGKTILGFIRDNQDEPGEFEKTGVKGRRHGVPQADIVAYIAEHSQMPDDAFERFLEEYYSIPGCQMRFHCFSKEPIRIAYNVADEGAEIPDNWWESP